MKKAPRIAIDTEADSFHHYYEKTCLIQLTLAEANFIVDPLSPIDLGAFLAALADKPLILHGGDYDLRMLRSSFSFRPDGEVFDTMLAAQLLGYKELSYAALAGRFFQVELPKKGKKSDWSRRPLTPDQLQYAADDTLYLPDMADKLAGSLAQLGRLEWHRESCRAQVEATARDNVRDTQNAWRIKGLSLLSRRELACVYHVWHWRERQAQKADRPPFKIMGNHLIIDLAVWAASHKKADLQHGPKLPRNCTGSRLKALDKALEKAREMDESDLPDHRRGRRGEDMGENLRHRMKVLREQCSKTAEALGLEPSVVATRRALAAVARERPKTVKDIMNTAGLMHWQATLLAPAARQIQKSP